MQNPWIIEPLEVLIRLGLALALGGVIGLEREQSNRAAGLRTNILVCVGSSLIMLISMYGFSEFVGEATLDPARLAAQVVSGIGFLGAGVILFNGFSVTGLTTAATLWVVAGIGLATGAGFYLPAVAATFIVLFSLLILNKVEDKWLRVSRVRLLRVKAVDRPGGIATITGLLQKRRIHVARMAVEQLKGGGDEEPPIVIISITANVRNKRIVSLIEELRRIQGVSEVAVE